MNIRTSRIHRNLTRFHNRPAPTSPESQAQSDRVTLGTPKPNKHLVTGAMTTLALAGAVGLTGILTQSTTALFISGGIAGGVLATALITRASEELHAL